jgi:predicted membrane protein
MENNYNDMNQFGGSKRPRIFSGLILLASGVLLLAYKMGAPIPAAVFTWPVLLIAIGFLTGFKSRFHNPGAFIMIAIGSIFLIDQNFKGLNFHNYILPVILIIVGLVYILRPKNTWSDMDKKKWRNVNYLESPVAIPSTENYSTIKNENSENEDGEYIEINAVLGGVKKIILSKNFKGGEINCFMGGTEINFLKADIQKPVVLEVNNVFGGTKLIVPSNWDVKNEVTAVFGGIEDKINISGNMPDVCKIIILKGACVFGGIDINNF